jgi:hypothetical protein
MLKIGRYPTTRKAIKMRIKLDIGDAIYVSVILCKAAYDAIKVAEEFPESEILVKAGNRKFELMNRFRKEITLDTLTVEALKEKF